MIELLAPAGSPESVIATVQNGADAIYLGLSGFNARRGAANFNEEEFAKAVRYCHIRGAKVYVTLNTVVGDRELAEAAGLARMASDYGADGIIIQDMGLIRVVREAVPDIPLHASTQMSVHNLAGVQACAEMGLTRAVLARELSYEQIAFITKHAPIETEVFVHGALCFTHSGQCYMSSLIGGRSGNRGACAQPCRMQYSLGGRMDDYPLSLKDNCLITKMQMLEDAGVACAKIEGRLKRPEYAAVVTNIYSKIIKERRQPTAAEMEQLELAFSRQGFTDGYFEGKRGKEMFGIRETPGKEQEKFFRAVNKQYVEGEAQRVPVNFYVLIKEGQPIQAGIEDKDGNRAEATGSVPQKAVRRGVTREQVQDQFYKTGGTPYYAENIFCEMDEGLHLSAAELNELRRRLINELTAKRAEPPKRRVCKYPPAPQTKPVEKDPVTIFQVLSAQQLTPELAELEPEYIYIPMEVLHNHPGCQDIFVENGSTPVVVLPRIINDNQFGEVAEMLKGIYDQGVREALVGNIGHVLLARKLGFTVRGDFGLNVFNSYTNEVLHDVGMESVTASFELRMAQIRDMKKPVNTEMIVYGRLPAMVSEQCIIKNSAGRCSCQTPGQLADRMGSVFPVVREYGCRNVIYNAHKLFLADKKADYKKCGLWGVRLMFTTESAHECVEVAKSYAGLSQYRPNGLTRGLYYRGVE
ncbi:MAG: U32 family peptidase [Oscillospiraceae bacterium]|nr:U32 family peptidase [Oscillospiraceae bacterium]